MEEISESLRLGKNGTIRMTGSEGNLVTFKVADAEVNGTEDEVKKAIIQVFGQMASPKPEYGMKRTPNWTFRVTVEGRIENLTSFKLSVQRKFMRVIGHFEESSGPIDPCG